MYVEKIKISYIYYLVIGFLGSNLIKQDNYRIDRLFKQYFTGWVLNWVKENIDSNYEKNSFFWYRMLIEISDSEENAVELFFELSENFFEECRKKSF